MRRRPVLISAAALLGLALAGTGWVAYRGMQAERALRSVGTSLVGLESVLSDGQTQALADQLPALQAQARRAREATSGPVWWLAEHVPVLGYDLVAVRTVSTAIDDVTTNALPAVSDLGTVLSSRSARTTDGRIDLAGLVDAAPRVHVANASMQRAHDAVAALDPSRLLAKLAGPVVQVQDGLDRAASVMRVADQVAGLVPSMLGADGPRTYLVMSLNSAELRAAGGIVGAVAELHAENGSISLLTNWTTADLPVYETSVLPLTADEVRVHSDTMGRWIQDVVSTPDFPRSAQLAQAMWKKATGHEVDGVIAVDPVAVSYLLAATGPVTVPGGVQVTQTNLVPILLHDAYLKITDRAAQDDFFGGVASAVFRAVADGHGDSRNVLRELTRAAQELRIRVWSSHTREQLLLRDTPLSSAFLSGATDSTPGIFLNDGTGGKLDYYLKATVSIETPACTPGSSEVVRLDLAYDPPADVATYPWYVVGVHSTTIPTGSVQTNITAYSPVGGRLLEQQLGSAYVGGITATESGRQVSVLTSQLKPGEHATYRFTIAGASSSPAVWTTPTITGPGVVHAACPAP